MFHSFSVIILQYQINTCNYLKTRARIPWRFRWDYKYLQRASWQFKISPSLSLSLYIFIYTRSRDLNQFNASNGREPLIIDRRSFRRYRSTLHIPHRGILAVAERIFIRRAKSTKAISSFFIYRFSLFQCITPVRGAGPFAVPISFLFPQNSPWWRWRRSRGSQEYHPLKCNYNRLFRRNKILSNIE